MKYLIVWLNEKNQLIWDIVNTKEQVSSFINVNMGDRIIRNRIERLSTLAQVFEIEPNYEVINIKIELPTLLKIKVQK